MFSAEEGKGYILLLSAVLLWGGAFAAAKHLVGTVDPMATAFFRFLLAFLTLLPITYLAARGEIVKLVRAGARQWLSLAVLGLTGVFGYNAFFFYGLQLTSAGEGSLIIATGPAVTALLAFLFLREAMGLHKVLGITVSFAGVVLLVQAAPAGGGTHEAKLLGDLLMIGAVLCWSIYSLLGKITLRDFSPLVSTTVAIGIGTLLLLPFALITDPGLTTIGLMLPMDWLSLLYLSLACTVFAFVAWYEGLRRVEVSRAVVFLNIVPLSSLLWASLFLGEAFGLLHLLGGGAIISGVFITSGYGGAGSTRPGAVPRGSQGP